MSMNPYILIGSGLGTAEAAALSQRLAAWHDAMVMHERRLRVRSYQQRMRRRLRTRRGSCLVG